MARLRALAVALLSLSLGAAAPAAPDVHIAIVVNAANPITSIPRARLSKIFLRDLTQWESGQEILPVEQIDKSPVRVAFTRDVQHQSVSAMRRYWQERIFTGNESPPPERVTDADVLTYVRSNPGAIGYVAQGTDLGTGVKAIPVTD